MNKTKRGTPNYAAGRGLHMSGLDLSAKIVDFHENLEISNDFAQRILHKLFCDHG